MNAKEFLMIALGGNMNVGTLKPLAIEEIMEAYAKYHYTPDVLPSAVLNCSETLQLNGTEIVDAVLGYYVGEGRNPVETEWVETKRGGLDLRVVFE